MTLTALGVFRILSFLAAGLGAVAGPFAGPLGGIIVTAMATSYRNQQAKILMYKYYGAEEIIKNSELSSADLSKMFAQAHGFSCHYK